jgi:hypothetical protein
MAWRGLPIRTGFQVVVHTIAGKTVRAERIDFLNNIIITANQNNDEAGNMFLSKIVGLRTSARLTNVKSLVC